MHVSNTVLSFDYPNVSDYAPSINVYTSSGGFLLIDSGSNLQHGYLNLYGGNPAITDLEIVNSTYGTLFSHANWSDISFGANAKARFVNSTLGGYLFWK